MLQGITSSALANSSSRFAAIQQLISAIGGATDQKAVLDLQARIGAEAGMLQNEQTKLQSLVSGRPRPSNGSMLSRTGRPLIAGHGQFAARFEPTPDPERGERMGFFATFSAWLDGQLTSYIGNNTARLSAALEPAIVTLGTLYVMFWGYLQLTGTDRGAIHCGPAPDHAAGRSCWAARCSCGCTTP